MTTPYAQLADLLRDLFTRDDLLHFLQTLPQGREIVSAIPTGGSLYVLSGEVVSCLERRGRVDRPLFEQMLRATDANRHEDIIRVAAAWGVRNLPVAPAQPVVSNAVNISGGSFQGSVVAPGAGQVTVNPGATPMQAQAPASSPPLALPGTLARGITGLDWDLFLAHASKDKPSARALFQHTGGRVRTFLDEQLPQGIDWDTAIANALHSSAVIAVLVSDASEEGYYLREEIRAVIGKARADGQWTRVVPVYLGGWPAQGARVPYGLGLKQGLAVQAGTTLLEVGEGLLRVVEDLVPRHRLAQALARIFEEPARLDGWLGKVPVVDAFVDPPFALARKDAPMAQAAREAVDSLVHRGRVDGALFDLLEAESSAHKPMIGRLRELWLGPTAE